MDEEVKKAGTTETIRVLVADDEQGMRSGMCRTVSHLKLRVPEVGREIRFEVVEVSDGRATIETLESQAFDILLLDHKMPDLSGLDILDHLHENKIPIVTVMISGFASLETAATATSRGAYDFLAKPFTPSDLSNVLCKAATLVALKKEVHRLRATYCQPTVGS